MSQTKNKNTKKTEQASSVEMFDGGVGQHVHKSNKLYYGDNLTIMRTMPDASVDLIYLDPPFNSQRTYNLRVFSRSSG